jgi:dCTP diphosphatase
MSIRCRYLVRLSDKCGIDLSAAVERKLQRNREKYPADLVRGSSKKYTEYGTAADRSD